MICEKPLRISFVKTNGFIRVYDSSRYLVLLGLENMMPFMIGLDAL